MPLIHLSDIHLYYQIRRDKRIKDAVVPYGKMRNRIVGEKRLHALNGVSLRLNDGDSLGVIGSNGAGKSTLLKLLAGIYPPQSGELEIRGSVAPLFELATGFEMEASGWDNIMSRGIMLGQSPRQMREKSPEIADFSELGEYLDMPVKYYSSGMFVRLAFSISTSIQPDILLLDEVMAAGDAAFIKKAEYRMKELMGGVKILVFVSHSMDSIKSFCNRAVWLDNGKIRAEGTPDEVVAMYQAEPRSRRV